MASDGQGWSLHDHPSGFCDGSAQSECARDTKENCLLYAHNDKHGVLMGDGFSGWLVMQLPGLKEGVIMARMETWRGPRANHRTEGWTEENNGNIYDVTSSQDSEENESNDMNNLDDENIEEGSDENRRLKEAPVLPDDIVFEIAIDGEIKAVWDKDRIEEERHSVAYNFDLFVFVSRSRFQ